MPHLLELAWANINSQAHGQRKSIRVQEQVRQRHMLKSHP